MTIRDNLLAMLDEAVQVIYDPTTKGRSEMKTETEIPPRPYVDTKTNAHECLNRMVYEHPKLYDECLDTLGFSYCFSQLANRACRYDEMVQAGQEKAR